MGRYVLEQHEEALLREMVRCVDQLDELHAITALEGLVVSGPHGQKTHPALTAAQQRIVLARLAAALRLPAGDEDDPAAGRRPQRRTGVRGVYNFSAGA